MRSRQDRTTGSSQSPKWTPRHRSGRWKPRSTRGFLFSQPHASTSESGVVSRLLWWVFGPHYGSRRKDPEKPPEAPVLWGFFI